FKVKLYGKDVETVTIGSWLAGVVGHANQDPTDAKMARVSDAGQSEQLRLDLQACFDAAWAEFKPIKSSMGEDRARQIIEVAFPPIFAAALSPCWEAKPERLKAAIKELRGVLNPKGPGHVMPSEAAIALLPKVHDF